MRKQIKSDSTIIVGYKYFLISSKGREIHETISIIYRWKVG